MEGKGVCVRGLLGGEMSEGKSESEDVEWPEEKLRESIVTGSGNGWRRASA